MTKAATNFDIHVPFVEHLGLQLLEKRNGVVRMRLDPQPEFLNSWGSVHGGALMTLLVLLALDVQIAPTIADYYMAHSAPDAHGRNVVNVILVDFRGVDTMGEITVLGIAATGVYAILRLRPRDDERPGARS